jgi:hypothetical protein
MAVAVPLFVIAAISPSFRDDLNDLDKPVLIFVGLMLSSGASYLWVLQRLQNTVMNKWVLAWILALGLIMRLSMLSSVPILEDDYFRYLWDGGVLAEGFNPYQYAPRQILDEGASDIPETLHRMAKESFPDTEHINYPYLKTIYPPVAQSAFALAHLLSPWSMNAWRLVLLALDVTTLFLFFALFRRMNLPRPGLALYWWNPLLIKEIYNSGHMDLIVLPFVLAALLFFINNRHILASGALGFALGAKFWPAILLPVVLRPLVRNPKRLISALLLFAGVSAAMLLPFSLGGLNADSGLLAYGRTWEMNDSLFMLLLWFVRFLIESLGLPFTSAQLGARVLATSLLTAWILWVIREDVSEPRILSKRFLMVVAALFLISPTQFPWYYVWVLPFLVFHPRMSLLILTALLPLYYLRPYLNARGLVYIHDYGLVWVQFAPVWALMIREWCQKGKVQSPP